MPEMAAYAALVSLSHTLHQILHPPPLNKIIVDRQQIEFLRGKVDFLIDFLETYPSRCSDEIEDLQMRIADAAYAAADIIEFNVVEQIHATDGEKISTLLCEGIQTVLEKFISIEKELMKMSDMHGAADVRPKSSTAATSTRPLPSGKIIMVGLDEHLIRIKEALATDEYDRQIISIVGMGGIGKTTLAAVVYNDPFVVEHFNVRAWITMSQEYTVRELLLRLLQEINKKAIDKQESIDDELGLLLHKELFDRRYLIVLDDMWDIEAWHKLQMFLPRNNNGSRILVTTRLSNLAEDFKSCNPYKMDLLDEGQSWDLLRKKVFAEEDCPDELEEIGKDIAKRCSGLPLALAVVGGLLAKFERTREHWESIAGDLNYALSYGNDEDLMKILSLSYTHLPIYLKPCFLYLAVFPEDFEIRVSSLIGMWVAEGLIKPTQTKCLEEVAEGYLKDLISRNLILVDKKSSRGKVKCCKIHDLLRDLCIIQAQKEKFVYITKLDNPNISPNIDTQRRLKISFPSKQVELTAIEALQSAKFNRFWLSHGYWWAPEGSDVESSEGWIANQIHGFRLLKVVHVKHMVVRYLTDIHIDISKLSNLRYVVATEVSCISSMSLCWNLQTLVVEFDGMSLPAEIWQMPQLRHVKIPGIHLPDPPDEQIVFVLENLQTLKYVRNFECTEQVLERIPNIKKLYINVSPESSATGENSCLKNLVGFKKLESLGLFYGDEKLWVDIAFPTSLKKLFLSHCYFCWEDLSIVGSLPNLEVLKLYYNYVTDENWYPKEEEFCRLKVLLISGCELKIWRAEWYHFPCLERLVLQRLMHLEEIPMSFAEILTLQVIDLYGVKDSVRISARAIAGEREQLGYEPPLQILYFDIWD